ncbi:hypothetical protein [Mycobacterium sp. AZCC_0083]|uniref:hypothetical protein n=1 Tax=Mycobacterium sp. AZCC_0083 TaxID=2735882 RepID=UPI0016137E65|nr:hypothetical protein [Mycobacterium sp. AZCC_0083]MBB5161252.1 hypothetical protein [Mycobacterium sp. AZCC_0083]
MCNEDRNPGWKPLGPYPLNKVPNKALVTGTLADWVVPVLEDAADEIDWISGEIRIDCYKEAAPALGTPLLLQRNPRSAAHQLLLSTFRGQPLSGPDSLRGFESGRPGRQAK